MILLIWISTIGKTVQLSHLTQKIPWDLHTSSLPCKWEVLALHTSSLPCKWEVLAHTHESRGQQWLVAIDLYSVPSRLQCFHTYSLKRTRHLRRLEELGGRSVFGPLSFGTELNIFFSNELQRPLGKYPEPVCSTHAPEMGIGMSQHSFLKLRS